MQRIIKVIDSHFPTSSAYHSPQLWPPLFAPWLSSLTHSSRDSRSFATPLLHIMPSLFLGPVGELPRGRHWKLQTLHKPRKTAQTPFPWFHFFIFSLDTGTNATLPQQRRGNTYVKENDGAGKASVLTWIFGRLEWLRILAWEHWNITGNLFHRYSTIVRMSSL